MEGSRFLVIILHLVRIGQAEAGQPQRASLEPVFKDLTSQGFAFYSLMTWYSVGSKWGRLAAAGLSVKLRGRRVNATNVIALCNELRCPSTEIHKAFIQHNLLPLILQLTEVIPLEILTLFQTKVRKHFAIPQWLDCREIVQSDKYFDQFFQQMTRAYLTGSSDVGDQMLSPESDSEDEKKAAHIALEPSLPIFLDNVQQEADNSLGPQEIIHSTYSYANAAAGKPTPYPERKKRQEWTEQERALVLTGKKVASLDDLGKGMRERFYEASESKAGRYKPKQKWLQVQNSVIHGREIKSVDANGDLIFYTNGKASEASRTRLLTSLKAFFNQKPGGVQLLYRDSATQPISKFSTFHFSYWGRYGQNGKEAPTDFFMRPSNDIQNFPEEYETLCNILGATLQDIVSTALKRFPEELKDVQANVDIFPMNDTSPVKPFTSFVLNINVETIAHRDKGDNFLCIVLDLGEHTGGELCLQEAKVSLELYHDSSGKSYQKDGNGWDGNEFYL
ncbi:hypothetical protein DFH05DRAFT_81989 [Lentinula detonsa]|uniref:Uncharacterized protein n=2 Tax=Lentinula TaxID=5352 RepID=A0A9W8U2V0_9AGAR|nr:hypothetical protein DFH05DRAFT_81989 [Lentinula detonsa]